MSKFSVVAGNPQPLLNYTGVIMPYKPPIDKVVALVIFNSYLAMHEAGSLETVEYWTENECSELQFAKWQAEKIYPIDLGKFKYHIAGFRSASECVVSMLKIELSDGLKTMVDLVNENNRTGNLKNRKYGVAFIMRELYELTEDTNFHVKVILNAAEVINAFVRVENGEIVQSVDGFEEALPDLVEKFAGCNYSPTTLGRYARDLWILGHTPVEIREKIGYWLTNSAEVRNRQIDGNEKWEKIQPNLREYAVGDSRGMYLGVANHFLAKAATRDRRYGYRILVDADGHTVISTNGLDLSHVYEKLNKREPGRWYYQQKMGALINGGPQYIGVKPTSMRPEKLVDLLGGAFPKKELPKAESKEEAKK